jgi:hypothetical protein
MKRLFPLVASAVVWMACAGAAHADPIPAPNASWTYNFTPSTNQVLATDKKSGVSLTNQVTQPGQGTSDVVATSVGAFSASTAQVGFGSGGAYSVSLLLTDTASGTHATFTFNGQFGGSLSGSNSKVTNTILGGTVSSPFGTVAFTGPQAPTVSLGNFNYSVDLNHYTPPGPPSENLTGSIGGTVTVTTLGVAQVPEPSTIVLSVVGLTLLGGTTWRKRRRLVAALA